MAVVVRGGGLQQSRWSQVLVYNAEIQLAAVCI